ncbi:MAG TPA: 2-phosphosulfolactate phosphatase [Verrucomicrobiae bacterium]|jgi:2-phosphosulfolactate phosphatase|nr:2-phosphosulfolactate phosphatase [Verrucomicrobiae bacterium]
MKIETILTPAELPALAQRDLRATACVVFDVLRATSTFVTALHHGAKAIIPVSEIAEALDFRKAEGRRQKAESILLGGERNGVRISADGIDFDLGNSPREYTPEKVRGKTIISTTTNGTRALRACVGAKIILASSFLNLSATAEFLRRDNFENILLVCAGTGENRADEDILAAGALVELLVGRDSVEPNSNSRNIRVRRSLTPPSEIALHAYMRAKLDLPGAVRNAENARRLLAIPELRGDVAFCSQRDIFPLVAEMEADGVIRISV